MANEPTAHSDPLHAGSIPALPPVPHPGKPPVDATQEEFVVYRHSNLFYWWPIWFFGYIMAAITYFGDWHMAIVPPNSEPAVAIEGKAAVGDKTIDLKDRNVLVLPEKKDHLKRKDVDGDLQVVQPKLYVSPQKGVGTLYMIILLIVIVITNVHFRGLWSVVVMLVLIMSSILFAVAGWWDIIFNRVSLLAIHINLGGYLLLSSVLFVLWLINFFFFDRQTYMIFATGQVRTRLEIGGEETVYDTIGMVVQKQRSDLFRHWILGFGSGDLIIHPSGVMRDIQMPNVLFAHRVVRKIEDMIREKVVLSSPEQK